MASFGAEVAHHSGDAVMPGHGMLSEKLLNRLGRFSVMRAWPSVIEKMIVS
jgi:hypothetical protein